MTGPNETDDSLMNFSDDDNSDTLSSLDDTFPIKKNNDFMKNKKKLPAHLKYAMDAVNPKICVNAITGQKYFDPNTKKPIYNNSFASTQLYIVMDTTSPIGNKDPLKLFYDTPEQYERHRRFKINRQMKEAWRERMIQSGFSPFGIGNSLSLTEAEPNNKKPILSDAILAHT